MTNPRILYVDDDKLNCVLFNKIMSKKFDVVLAQSPSEAKSLIEKSSDNFEVIIADYKFENDVQNGLDFLTEFQSSNNEGQLLILCSGYRTQISSPVGSTITFSPKPINFNQLKDTISDAFDLR